jgi:hypothetical protein
MQDKSKQTTDRYKEEMESIQRTVKAKEKELELVNNLVESMSKEMKIYSTKLAEQEIALKDSR